MTETMVALCAGLVITACSDSEAWRSVGAVIAVVSASVMAATAVLGAVLSMIVATVQ